MMARGTKGSKQRPDTLMQDRTSPTRRSLLATHGRTIHWVIFDRSGQSCLPVHVRLAPKADLRLGATDRRRVEVGRTPVIQAPKLGSFESCAMNLPTTNGLPSSRCCPTSPAACLG